MSPTKFYHVIQIILYMCSCDQSLVTVAFLWDKLSQPQFYKDLARRTAFFEWWSWFRLNNLGLPLKLEILHQCGKRVKTKSQKVSGTNSYVCKVTGEKLVGVVFLPPPPLILNRVKKAKSYRTNALLVLRLTLATKCLCD